MIVLAAALLVAMPAWADFASDYVAGLAALDHGDYAQAEQYLKKALDAQSNPVGSVNIGGNEQPYLPHHFLGMVAFRRGDCTTAGAEWGSAMNRRMLARFNQLRLQEQQLLGKCQPRAAGNDEKPATGQVPSSSNPESQAAPGNPVAAAPTGDTVKPTATAHAAPPASLVRTFDDYVAGRYSQAARIDPAVLTDPRARFHAYLLRSAARFALVRLGADKVLLDDARHDASAAKALERTVPDAAVFSSSFRAFYGSAQ
jgi:hypothetical protein